MFREIIFPLYAATHNNRTLQLFFFLFPSYYFFQEQGISTQIITSSLAFLHSLALGYSRKNSHLPMNGVFFLTPLLTWMLKHNFQDKRPPPTWISGENITLKFHWFLIGNMHNHKNFIQQFPRLQIVHIAKIGCLSLLKVHSPSKPVFTLWPIDHEWNLTESILRFTI